MSDMLSLSVTAHAQLRELRGLREDIQSLATAVAHQAAAVARLAEATQAHQAETVGLRHDLEGLLGRIAETQVRAVRSIKASKDAAEERSAKLVELHLSQHPAAGGQR